MGERDALPTGGELAELMAYEPPHDPPPPALPVRKRFYLTKCPHCQWVGSSEQCGSEPGDDSDVWCPVCHSPGCEAAPSLTESEEHGEGVYQRLTSADAERDAALAALQRVTAENENLRKHLESCALAAGHSPIASYPISTSIHRLRKQFDTATAGAASLRAEVAAKDKALKLCLAELDWQVSAAEHCGDPDRECPMQDIGKPRGEHMQAREAARTALARAATAGEGRSDG
jgi:hypothetical protein